jgi:hypothetical protein
MIAPASAALASLVVSIEVQLLLEREDHDGKVFGYGLTVGPDAAGENRAIWEQAGGDIGVVSCGRELQPTERLRMSEKGGRDIAHYHVGMADVAWCGLPRHPDGHAGRSRGILQATQVFVRDRKNNEKVGNLRHGHHLQMTSLPF